MNAEFSRCCDFLARMIEKYGLLVLQEYYAELKIEIDEWKFNPLISEDRIFFYAEALDRYRGRTA